MFRNLYFQVSSFIDFNFSDFLDQLDEVREEYLEARIREGLRGEDIEPYFDPIIPLTLRPESCRSFIRANPGLPITERDYYLSKLFQYVSLLIKNKFRLGFEQLEGLRERLEEVLDQIPDELLPELHRFDWWGFYELVEQCDPEPGVEGQTIKAILGSLSTYLPKVGAQSPPDRSASGAPGSIPVGQVRKVWHEGRWPEKLREARARRDQVQKQAADRCGVDLETYKKWEQGRGAPAERCIPRIIQYIEGRE